MSGLIPQIRISSGAPSRMRVYGLTGGTGSGKSEIARMIAAQGIPVLNADRIGHETIAPGGSAENAVIDAFGPDILTNGAIDRTKLGALVFADPEALTRLNNIVHPRIRDIINTRCLDLEREGHPIVVIDAALLADDGAVPPFLDGLALVECDTNERVSRLVQSRGLKTEDAWTRVRAQVSPEQKRPLANWLIDNNGSLEQLVPQVDALIHAWRIHGGLETG